MSDPTFLQIAFVAKCLVKAYGTLWVEAREIAGSTRIEKRKKLVELEKLPVPPGPGIRKS